ncbi:hypothetical protein K469DRAFT_686900 [Zopfia rhizophila CBS 207.26]|uniref:Uncharacterized protein n=1 Tax=Zopfia rhizophila CBS 207.26 TaxID=1314779 RepID=A0A6A6E675_9PEZI|nr:hypothetical protein K469DRAFT_686900 [Zopfia rhizophila CBS 207.26]
MPMNIFLGNPEDSYSPYPQPCRLQTQQENATKHQRIRGKWNTLSRKHLHGWNANYNLDPHNLVKSCLKVDPDELPGFYKLRMMIKREMERLEWIVGSWMGADIAEYLRLRFQRDGSRIGQAHNFLEPKRRKPEDDGAEDEGKGGDDSNDDGGGGGGGGGGDGGDKDRNEDDDNEGDRDGGGGEEPKKKLKKGELKEPTKSRKKRMSGLGDSDYGDLEDDEAQKKLVKVAAEHLKNQRTQKGKDLIRHAPRVQLLEDVTVDVGDWRHRTRIFD